MNFLTAFLEISRPQLPPLSWVNPNRLINKLKNNIVIFLTNFYLNKPFIIESGVWKGQSTWLIENTCPNSKLLCIDPNLYYRNYISKKAEYTNIDWKNLDIKNTENTLCFFDDHQNALERVQSAIKRGFKHLIFEIYIIKNFVFC